MLMMRRSSALGDPANHVRLIDNPAELAENRLAWVSDSSRFNCWRKDSVLRRVGRSRCRMGTRQFRRKSNGISPDATPGTTVDVALI